MCFGDVLEGYDDNARTCFASDCSIGDDWYGSHADAVALCEQCDGCTALHDWNGDANNWRACSMVQSGGDNNANVILYQPCSTAAAYEYTLLGTGYCTSYTSLPDGWYPSLLDDSDPLYDADRIRECMNRCLAAYESGADGIGNEGFYVKSNQKCACSNGACVPDGSSRYTSYSISQIQANTQVILSKQTAEVVSYTDLQVSSTVYSDSSDLRFVNKGRYSEDCSFIRLANADADTYVFDLQISLDIPFPSIIYLDFWYARNHSTPMWLQSSPLWERSEMPGTTFTNASNGDTFGPGFVFERSYSVEDNPVGLLGNDGNGQGTYYPFVCPLPTFEPSQNPTTSEPSQNPTLLDDTCRDVSNTDCFFGENNWYNPIYCGKYIYSSPSKICSISDAYCSERTIRYRICQGDDCAVEEIYSVQDCAERVNQEISRGYCDEFGIFESSFCTDNSTPECSCLYNGAILGDIRESGDGRSIYVLKTPEPTISPSRIPTTSTPSTSPSVSPSVYPSTTPSSSPNTAPSVSPSVYPSTTPSSSPNTAPSLSPSTHPSTIPSNHPSTESPSYSPLASNIIFCENGHFHTDGRVKVCSGSENEHRSVYRIDACRTSTDIDCFIRPSNLDIRTISSGICNDIGCAAVTNQECMAFSTSRAYNGQNDGSKPYGCYVDVQNDKSYFNWNHTYKGLEKADEDYQSLCRCDLHIEISGWPCTTFGEDSSSLNQAYIPQKQGANGFEIYRGSRFLQWTIYYDANVTSGAWYLSKADVGFANDSDHVEFTARHDALIILPHDFRPGEMSSFDSFHCDDGFSNGSLVQIDFIVGSDLLCGDVPDACLTQAYGIFIFKRDNPGEFPPEYPNLRFFQYYTNATYKNGTLDDIIQFFHCSNTEELICNNAGLQPACDGNGAGRICRSDPHPSATPTAYPTVFLTTLPTFHPTEAFTGLDTEWCPDSAEQLCRMPCSDPTCSEGQCALRNGTCCDYSCMEKPAGDCFFKISHGSGRCWRFKNEQIELGANDCSDGDIFYLDDGRLKKNGKCIIKSSIYSRYGGYLLTLGNGHCNDSNVITGVAFESSGMLAYTDGYLVNARGRLDAPEGTTIITYGSHNVAPRVFQTQQNVTACSTDVPSANPTTYPSKNPTSDLRPYVVSDVDEFCPDGSSPIDDRIECFDAYEILREEEAWVCRNDQECARHGTLPVPQCGVHWEYPDSHWGNNEVYFKDNLVDWPDPFNQWKRICKIDGEYSSDSWTKLPIYGKCESNSGYFFTSVSRTLDSCKQLCENDDECFAIAYSYGHCNIYGNIILTETDGNEAWQCYHQNGFEDVMCVCVSDYSQSQYNGRIFCTNETFHDCPERQECSEEGMFSYGQWEKACSTSYPDLPPTSGYCAEFDMTQVTQHCEIDTWSGNNCKVAVNTDRETCAQWCESQGSTCVTAGENMANSGDENCVRNLDVDEDCDAPLYNQICVCTPLEKSPRLCFTVLSVDHKSVYEGAYFNFDIEIVSSIRNWMSDEEYLVIQYRNGTEIWGGSVILWKYANGGSIGDGHGRRSIGAVQDQWHVDDQVCFDDPYISLEAGTLCPSLEAVIRTQEDCEEALSMLGYIWVEWYTSIGWMPQGCSFDIQGRTAVFFTAGDEFIGFPTDRNEPICHNIPDTQICDRSDWPDVKTDCGGCRVLIDNFHTYGSCRNYCTSVGRHCVFAAEEWLHLNSCDIHAQYACDDQVDKQDFICGCGEEITLCQDADYIINMNGTRTNYTCETAWNFIQNNTDIQVCPPLLAAQCRVTCGLCRFPHTVVRGNWRLVRRVAPGNSWHPANDQLNGTAEYGTFTNNTIGNTTFSIPYNIENVMEFLFASGDGEFWLVASREAVLDGFYDSHDERDVIVSSLNNESHALKWIREEGIPEDPKISLEDITADDTKVLYAGDGMEFSDDARNNIVLDHNGANVFVQYLHEPTISPTSMHPTVPNTGDSYESYMYNMRCADEYKIFDFVFQGECESECTLIPTCHYYWFSQHLLGWCRLFTDCQTTIDIPYPPSTIYKRILASTTLRPAESCPTECRECGEGNALEGGLLLKKGICEGYCSQESKCGLPFNYQNGGVDCLKCATKPHDNCYECVSIFAFHYQYSCEDSGYTECATEGECNHYNNTIFRYGCSYDCKIATDAYCQWLDRDSISPPVYSPGPGVSVIVTIRGITLEQLDRFIEILKERMVEDMIDHNITFSETQIRVDFSDVQYSRRRLQGTRSQSVEASLQLFIPTKTTYMAGELAKAIDPIKVEERVESDLELEEFYDIYLTVGDPQVVSAHWKILKQHHYSHNGNIEKPMDLSVQDCQFVCNEKEGCGGFAYDIPREECQLLGNLTKDGIISNANFDLFIKFKDTIVVDSWGQCPEGYGLNQFQCEYDEASFFNASGINSTWGGVRTDFLGNSCGCYIDEDGMRYFNERDFGCDDHPDNEYMVCHTGKIMEYWTESDHCPSDDEIFQKSTPSTEVCQDECQDEGGKSMSWEDGFCRCSLVPGDSGPSGDQNCYRLTYGTAPLTCTGEEIIEINSYIDDVFEGDWNCLRKLRDADGNITAEECKCFLQTDPNDAPVVTRGCLYHRDHTEPLTEMYYDCEEKYPDHQEKLGGEQKDDPSSMTGVIIMAVVLTALIFCMGWFVWWKVWPLKSDKADPPPKLSAHDRSVYSVTKPASYFSAWGASVGKSKASYVEPIFFAHSVRSENSYMIGSDSKIGSDSNFGSPKYADPKLFSGEIEMEKMESQQMKSSKKKLGDMRKTQSKSERQGYCSRKNLDEAMLGVSTFKAASTPQLDVGGDDLNEESGNYINSDDSHYLKKQLTVKENIYKDPSNYFSDGRYVTVASPKSEMKRDAAKRADTQSQAPAVWLDSEDVSLGKKLASGGFAKIFTGEYRACVCAFKQILDQEDLETYTTEGELLKHVSNHPYICRYYGCAKIDNTIYLVVDLYRDGSVLDAVKRRPFNQHDKLTICYQCASGLLHLKKEKILHCDLAARNCLIDFSGRLRTAITDFGLSCQAPCTKEIKTLAPRWASPGLLRTRIPTFESDMWAFGVTCWEIFSNGMNPYGIYRQSKVIQGLLSEESPLRLKLDEAWAITPLLQDLFSKPVDVKECVQRLRVMLEDTSQELPALEKMWTNSNGSRDTEYFDSTPKLSHRESQFASASTSKIEAGGSIHDI